MYVHASSNILENLIFVCKRLITVCFYLDPFSKYANEIEEVPYNAIEGRLIAEGLIHFDEQQKVSSLMMTDNQKQRLFRDIVLKYNLEKCEKFLKCLKEIEHFPNYEKLYEKLRKALGKLLYCMLAIYVV